jgi:hypothetical protein
MFKPSFILALLIGLGTLCAKVLALDTVRVFNHHPSV